MDIPYLKDTLLHLKYVNPTQVERFLFVIQRDVEFFSIRQNFEDYAKYMFGPSAGDLISKIVRYHEDQKPLSELPQSESQ